MPPMNRRGFFKALAATAASTLLPLGALAALGRPRYLDLTFTTPAPNRSFGLDEFEQWYLNPTVQRLAERLDAHYGSV